ncbi:branched-chain amino acid transport system II carrier protein [Alkalihalobacillus deserti]|uniref:branched-chain amino acid transport system II carrier protein n=1 Tax=Alkalihalobacillus deserti TaxID=2879466 RepID=UPI00223D1376|nr:branched-chain amino acid transport system II carrier protein [Alkalihalobacillus deserti]
MNKNTRDSFIFGFTLFSLFFGSNLFFSPAIGLVSGDNWPIALLGFFLAGIVVPVLAIIGVLNSEGRFEITNKAY